MYQEIPNRLRPGIALFGFWILTLILNILVDSKDDWDSFFVQSILCLSWLIIPYTIISGVILYKNIGEIRGKWKRLGFFSILIRSAIVMILSIVVLFPWIPGLLRSGRSAAQSTEISIRSVEMLLDGLKEDYTPWLMGRLPRRETEFRKLPKEVISILGFLSREQKIDGWGRPFMFVAEDRESGLWVGVYSTGQDGVSLTRGNDPDDLNTWSQDNLQYYNAQRAKRNGEASSKLRKRFLIAILFFIPICFLTFRRPYFPEDHIA